MVIPWYSNLGYTNHSLELVQLYVIYILACIDALTQYAFVHSVRTKMCKEILEPFKPIITQAISSLKTLVVDHGAEFNYPHCSAWIYLQESWYAVHCRIQNTQACISLLREVIISLLQMQWTDSVHSLCKWALGWS